MQDQPDSYSVRLERVPGCTCLAHGLLIRHTPDCEAFIPGSALTRDQIETLAAGFIALYDRHVAQGKRRHRLTEEGRGSIRQAIGYAEQLLGEGHRYGPW